MNILAKHFFDYQSFVNLPHKAIQLNKIPPSQAGCDPSAAWAPKSMHLAGKNQPAPAARANRHYEEHRSGRHRHGRPAKLEFRHWGERHGELHEEKIIPHKDPWMTTLKGDFKHFYEYDKTFDSDGVDSALQHFPTFSQRCVEVDDMEVLTILTLTSKMNLVMITVKAICNYSYPNTRPLIKVQIFEGSRLVDERLGKNDSLNKYNKKYFLIATKKNYGLSTVLLNKNHSKINQKFSRGFGRIVESQMHPNILMYCQKPQNYFQGKNHRVPCINQSVSDHFAKNQNKFTKFFNLKFTKTNFNKKNTNKDFFMPKKQKKTSCESPSIMYNKSPTFSLLDDSSKNRYQNYTNLSENFTFPVSAARLQQFHILVQIYVPYQSSSSTPSSMPNKNINNNSFSNLYNVINENCKNDYTDTNLFNEKFEENTRIIKNEVLDLNVTNEKSNIKNTDLDSLSTKKINELCANLEKSHKCLKKSNSVNNTNSDLSVDQSLSSKLTNKDKLKKNSLKKSLSETKNKFSGLFDSSLKSESNTVSTENYPNELDLLSEQFNSLNSKDCFNLINEFESSSLKEQIDIETHRSRYMTEKFDTCDEEDNKTIEDFDDDRNNKEKKFDKHKGNIMLGGFVIGPLSSSRGRWHWRQMIQRHGYPVCMWHKLIQPVVNI